MLALAKVTKTDVVIDLGCGDGRIPITAAKVYGARGIGVDIDPQRIAEANANARQAKASRTLVTFKLENALTTDVSSATVVTTYLLTASNLKLRPVLTRALKPGTRIVAHNFGFGDWTPEKVDTFTDSAKTPPHVVPVDGRRDRPAVAAACRDAAGAAARPTATAPRRSTRGTTRWRWPGWRPAARRWPWRSARSACSGCRRGGCCCRSPRSCALAVAHARLLETLTHARRADAYVDARPRPPRPSLAGHAAPADSRYLPAGSSLRRRPRPRSAPAASSSCCRRARTDAGERRWPRGCSRRRRPPRCVERQDAVRDLAGRDAVPRGPRRARPRRARRGADSAALVAWARQPVAGAAAPGRHVVLVALVGGDARRPRARGSRTGTPPDWLAGALAVQALVGWWLAPPGAGVDPRNSKPRARDLALVAAALSPGSKRSRSPRRASCALQARLAVDRRAGLGRGPAAVAPRRAADVASEPVLRAAGGPAVLGHASGVGDGPLAARASARHVPGWLDALGELEALASLGGYAAEHPDDVYPGVRRLAPPRLMADGARASAAAGATAVGNDLALGGEAPLAVARERLEHVGQEHLAARRRASTWCWRRPARRCAPRRCTLTPLLPAGTLRVQDSLQAGRSRFFAEITKLRQIVERRGAAATAAPATLFLIDELLAGTNSHDRRHGADGVLRGLLDLGAIGLATTHDLALTDLADALAPRAANVHFVDRFDDGGLELRLPAARPASSARQQRAGADAIGRPRRLTGAATMAGVMDYEQLGLFYLGRATTPPRGSARPSRCSTTRRTC